MTKERADIELLTCKNRLFDDECNPGEGCPPSGCGPSCIPNCYPPGREPTDEQDDNDTHNFNL